MQINVIMAVNYPVTSIDSVVLVREIKQDASGKVSFISTHDVARAQRFGAEAHMVCEWLKEVARVDVDKEAFWQFSFIEAASIEQKPAPSDTDVFKDALMGSVQVALTELSHARDGSREGTKQHLYHTIQELKQRFDGDIGVLVTYHGGSNYSIEVTRQHGMTIQALRIDVVNNQPAYT